MNRLLLAALLASLGLTACAKKEDAAAPSAAAPVASTPAAVEPKADAAVPAAEVTYPPNTGKLVQILQAGGYTYGEVAGPQGQTVWIAGGHIEAQPGDMVQWGDFAQMRNFTAKSLNRTFDEILFVNSWGPVGGTPAQVAAHGMPQGAAMPAAPDPHAGIAAHGGGSGIAPMAAPERTGVVKTTTTAGGYTYLEVAQGDASVWIAAPEAQVKVGDKVSWDAGMVMRNFNAKSLNRTFDQIVFSGGVSVVQ